MDIASSVALVTGASRGIGRVLALALAQRGATVVCTARTLEGPRDRGSLSATIEEIARGGGRAAAVPCDVTDPTAVANLVAITLDRYGRIDILINNAGFYPRGQVGSMEAEALTAAIAVNLTGPLLLCRYVLPGMIARRSGAVMSVSSGSARAYDRGHVAYSAAKAGLERLTINLAEEVREHGIAVNALDPGLVATEMSGGRGDPPESVVPAALWVLEQPVTFTGQLVRRRDYERERATI